MRSARNCSCCCWRAVQRRIVGGPGGDQRAAAAQAVGQQRDGQRIALGGVVAVDRIEVAEHQERRPGHAGRQQQRGRRVVGRDRAAVGTGDARGDPLAQRALGLAPRAGRVPARRHAHLEAPGLAGLPAGALEIVGGGRQRVGHAVDQIAAPVAIAVHRDALVGAGHELGLPERAGPRAGQPIKGQIARLQQRQGRQQFAAEELLPAAEARQRGQRHQQRPLALHPAVVALHAPDRHHRGRIHAAVLRHARQHLRVLGAHRLAIGDALGVDQRRQVVPDRRGELGLTVQQRQHAHVRHHAGHEAIERGRRDPRSARSRARHAAGVGGAIGVAGGSRIDGRLLRLRRPRHRGHQDSRQVASHASTPALPLPASIVSSGPLPGLWLRRCARRRADGGLRATRRIKRKGAGFPPSRE